MAGARLALGDGAVLGNIRVHKRDIALVRLRLFIHQRKDAQRARARHGNGVYLLGQGVDVTGELLGHIEKRHEYADSESLAGEAEIRYARKNEQSSRDGKDDIHDVADVADDGAENA